MPEKRVTCDTAPARGDSLAKSIAFGIPLAAVLIGSLSMLSEGNFRRTAAAEWSANYGPPHVATGEASETAANTGNAITETASTTNTTASSNAANVSITETAAGTKLTTTAASSTNLANSKSTLASGKATTPAAHGLGLSRLGDSAKSSAVRSSTAGADNCAACHQVQNGISHPVGITPSMKVPEALPLFAGRLACITCHDPQAATDHTARKSSGRTYLREEDKLTSLCAQCHTPESTRGTSHGSARIKAHNSNMPSGLNTKPAGHTTGIDSESRTCMACHDGGMAADAGSHSRLSMNAILSSEHPIGVKYQAHPARASDEIKLKPIRSIDQRVRLFNERIGCGSCHSVYGGEKKLLVMSNLNSRLCLACHEQ